MGLSVLMRSWGFGQVGHHVDQEHAGDGRQVEDEADGANTRVVINFINRSLSEDVDDDDQVDGDDEDTVATGQRLEQIFHIILIYLITITIRL